MIRHELDLPFDVYETCLAEGTLPVEQATSLRALCGKLGLSRVAVFGSNSGTGGPLRQALGDAFSFMLNTETVSPGVSVHFDAVLLGVHPGHYDAVDETLEKNFPGLNVPLLVPFRLPRTGSGEPPAAPVHDPGKRVRPCHYQDLFVRHDGDVFPCCLTKDDIRYRIGNIRDEDFADHFASYDIGECRCAEWAYNSVFRPATPQDRVEIAMLNVELSLFCNSSCAMCCVHSPLYTEDFKKPDASTHEGILRLFERFKPRGAYFQGGEVLVQPESFSLIKNIRRVSPQTAISLITNANVPRKAIEQASDLYDSFCIGFYGFQPHTYRTVTGLSIDRAKRSAQWLIDKDRRKVCLKYLSTPISFHEAPLFLEWALDVKPQSVMLVDADTQDYVRYRKPERKPRFADPGAPLNDLYWDAVIGRTRKRIDAVLEARGEYIREHGISVTLCGGLFSQG